MWDFLSNFIVEIVVVAVTSVGTLLITWLRRVMFNGSLRKLWRFKEKNDKKIKDINCYTANSGCRDDNEFVTLGYIFEYMAVGELRVAFKKLFKNIDISVQMSAENYADVRKRDLRDNLVLIGGPFHNCLTRRFLFEDRFDFPFSFDADANLYYRRGTDDEEVFCPQIGDAGNKYIESDYALIVNIRNPKAPDKRLFAFIGCRSAGCYAGAYFVANKLKELKKIIKDDEYALVVSCECDNEDVITEPVFERYYKLDSKKPELRAPAQTTAPETESV